MSVPIAVVSIAQVRTRLAAVASESTAAAPPIPHIRMWGVLRSAHARCCRHGRSGLARPFATHISTARPQCRLLTTATVPTLRRDGEEEELAPGFSQKVGAAAAYGPMVGSLRYGENLIVHPFHPRHPYYWGGGGRVSSAMSLAHYCNRRQAPFRRSMKRLAIRRWEGRELGRYETRAV